MSDNKMKVQEPGTIKIVKRSLVDRRFDASSGEQYIISIATEELIYTYPPVTLEKLREVFRALHKEHGVVFKVIEGVEYLQ